MKKIIVLTAALLIVLPLASTYADDAHHPEKQSQEKGASMSSGMMGKGMMMDKMQEHMKKTMELMSRIHSTKDDKERSKLMDEHMQSMHKGMDMMRNMGSGMMMGMMGKDSKESGMMMGGMGMDKKGSELSGKDMEKMRDMKMEGGDDKDMRHNMMEKRMDMMQMMMEQMMQHQEQEVSTPRHKHRK